MYDKFTSFHIIDTKVYGEDLIKLAAPDDLTEPFDPEFLYVRVRAISAGEYWGSNKNADYFSEKELINSHHTFMDSHVFKNHDNKDVAAAIGSVLKTEWNPKMKYVELLIKIDRKLAPTIVRGFEKGTATDVSMGCRVSHTICSICGNKAKTRAEFCAHVRTMRNQTMPDGKKVFEYNIGPKFHDISVVLNGADKTAKLIEIVASSSDYGLEKAASDSMSFTPMRDEAADPTQPLEFDNPINLHKSADIQKNIIDKLYTLSIVNRGTPSAESDEKEEPDTDTVDEATAVDEIMGIAREAGVLVAIELEKTSSLKDVRNVAIGATGIALATNYLQGKRLRGERTSKVENFIADNPGVLPVALALIGYPAYKGFKRRMAVLKQANLTIDDIEKDYTQLFTKEASMYSVDTSDTINIFNNNTIDTKLETDYKMNRSTRNLVKSAAINYGLGREDLVNIAKEKYHITDVQIGNFIKVSYDLITEAIEKEASIAKGIIEAQLVNPTTNRGMQVGLSAPIIVGSLIDGYLFHKFFSNNDNAAKKAATPNK